MPIVILVTSGGGWQMQLTNYICLLTKTRYT